jgi:hypothetical protein
MGEYSEPEADTFFSYIAALSIEERNELDEYLRALPEFNDWDDAGTLLRLKEKVLEASAHSGTSRDAIDEGYRDILQLYGRYRELHNVLRRRVKAWCRAMVDEPA